MADTKEQIRRQITLLYYNRVLRARGIITQQEFCRLAHQIQEKYSGKAK